MRCVTGYNNFALSIYKHRNAKWTVEERAIVWSLRLSCTL